MEKVKKLGNPTFGWYPFPTRGIELAEVLEKELSSKTGLKIRKGIIDPSLYRNDQNRVGIRLIKATNIPIALENQEIL